MVPYLFDQTGHLFTDTGQVSFKFYSVFFNWKKMAASTNLENDGGRAAPPWPHLTPPAPAGSGLIEKF